MTELHPHHQPLSRRRVVRTAAHAAWAVPAVSLATAAPAFAASGPAAMSVAISPPVVSGAGTLASPWSIAFPVMVGNVNTQATTALRYTVQVALMNADQWGFAPTASSTDASPGAGTGTPGAGLREFVLTATSQVPGNSSRTPTFSVTTRSATKPVVMSIVVQAAPGVAGTSGQDTYYA